MEPEDRVKDMADQTLFVIEEDTTLRYLLTVVFQKYGWQVKPFNNSTNAVTAYSDMIPNLIIMEPAVDRTENWLFLSSIAATPHDHIPPIILITFLDTEPDFIPAQLSAMSCITAKLIKPFDIDQLVILANHALRAHH